jgi:hypothetical protein
MALFNTICKMAHLLYYIMVYYVTGIICGEMSAKAVAQSYWTKELEEELEELGIREKWLFTTNAAGRPFSGSGEEAMEFVEKNRSEKLYDHHFSNQCKKKGKQS